MQNCESSRRLIFLLHVGSGDFTIMLAAERHPYGDLKVARATAQPFLLPYNIRLRLLESALLPSYVLRSRGCGGCALCPPHIPTGATLEPYGARRGRLPG